MQDRSRHPSGDLTVVTATARLARVLADRHARSQLERGAPTWETPRILPIQAWIADLYNGRDGLSPIRMLLAPAQQRALWEAVVADVFRGADLISLAGLARAVSKAWRICHAYRIPLAEIRRSGAEDALMFSRLADNFEARCRELDCLDSARVVDVLTSVVRAGEIAAPCVSLAGFTEIPPQLQALLDTIAAVPGGGVTVLAAHTHEGGALRIACRDTAEGLRFAAAWARERLDADSSARIGVVVPELKARHAQVERIFTEMFYPGRAVADGMVEPRAFGIMDGRPLGERALIRAALTLLDLLRGKLDCNEASRLLRSPFLAGSTTERTARACLDATLREQGGIEWDLARLRSVAGRDAGCQILGERLGRLAEMFRDLRGRQGPARWAAIFADALARAGWPGERALSDVERELVEKWRETLDVLASLDAVSPPVDLGGAKALLRRLVMQTVFEPDVSEPPVQIVSPDDSAGLDFDALWVADLTDEAWPPAPQPIPLLPIALQRRYHVPLATAASALAHAEAMTGFWLRAAPEVVLSYAQAEADRGCRPSRLIAHVEARYPETVVRPAPAFRESVFTTAASEVLRDEVAPPFHAAGAARGGTALIRDQAACPFRAFAHHRLGACPIAEPSPGFDAIERGQLAHRVLSDVWQSLGDSQGLRAIAQDRLNALVMDATRSALAESIRRRPDAGEIFARIEQARVQALVHAWLVIERQRAPFRVVECERKHAVTIAGLGINARIDRVDELANGARTVLDYKTGKASPTGWRGERPDEPQLPLYACFATTGDVAGAAFAVLDADAPRFAGLTRNDGMLPGVLPVVKLARGGAEVTWDEMVPAWRATLENLARAFLAGDARVDPKRASTCQYCDLHALCRIHERDDLAGRFGDFEVEEDGDDNDA